MFEDMTFKIPHEVFLGGKMKIRFVLSCLLSLSSIQASAFFGKPMFPSPGPSEVAPVTSKKTIPVIMYVITDDAGRGNDKWLTEEYTDKVIAEVNNYFNSDIVRFQITKKIQVRDSERYRWSQKKLLNKYDSKDKRGAVTVVISSETYDGSSSGRTHGRLDSEPMFVMRSRHNSLDRTADDYFDSAVAIRKTARLFIHEFGHEMGLEHKGEKKGAAIHTENFVEPGKDGNVDGKGRRFYENYFKGCLVPKKWFCSMGSVK